MTLHIPADVPQTKEQEFRNNYQTITKQTDRLFLFACDQKIEHLNKDFYGNNIDEDALSPEHVFTIAQQGRIGAFATHLGLISRYAKKFEGINYIVKLNGKTNLVKKAQRDPVSKFLWTVQDVVNFKQKTGINIRGVGYTIYMGSEYEPVMLKEAAKAVYEAHQNGLVTILWIYPRGKSIQDDQDPELVAGATGLAASLGSDFVKVKPPRSTAEKTSAQWLKVATQAAGNTKVICSGGAQKDPKAFLEALYDQIHIGGTNGAATGRNIFQKSQKQAIVFTQAIAALIYDNAKIKEAMRLFSESS